LAIACDFSLFRGLSDMQSMDNAQLARNIERGRGFTTEFLRPYAVAQLRENAVNRGLLTGKPGELFPADQFPPGTPRVLPDTYNAPGYPFLLAFWFSLVHPEFEEPSSAISTSHIYSPDRWIPPLNQIFMVITAAMMFSLSRRLFDDRVAWFSVVAFLATDLVWKYTLTALSTSFLMFLFTGLIVCVVEIYIVSERCFASEERSFAPAWIWGLLLSVLVGVSALTRLPMLIMLVPLMVLLLVIPHRSFLLAFVVPLVSLAMVIPWFVHLNSICGNPVGSNAPLLLLGQGDYSGNQIYCTTFIPSYDLLFGDAVRKEVAGLGWHFEHAWGLLGTNPVVLLFAASILHQFKRSRARMLHWFLYGAVLLLVVVTNIFSANPAPLDSGNAVILLLPGMIIIGSAYFFILLDRLNLPFHLLQTLLIVVTFAITILPLILSLTTPNNVYYAFPPYMPPLVKTLGQFAEPQEWVTTDMPWATAWYADRASLWLPDTISDFQNLNDNVCPTGVLLLTPVSWSKPLSTYTTGEYKDWLPFMTQQPAPADFPLTEHTSTPPGGPEYSIWSDRQRWR
jgi:4-amino-4-deoxy-L-arabinose transferase-like glycosyltransferase